MLFRCIHKLNFKIFTIGLALTIFLFSFSLSSYVNKFIFIFIFLPLFLGLIIREILLKIPKKQIFHKLFISIFCSVFILPLIFYFESIKEGLSTDFEDFLVASYIGFISLFVLLNIFYNEKKYILTITFDTFVIQVLMFIYFLQDMNIFIIGTILLLILFSFATFLNNKYLKLILSILSLAISFIFWGYYIVYLFSYYGNLSFELNIKTINMFFELILFGTGLGIMLQNFFLLSIYLPSRNYFYGKKHRRMIVDTNKKLIERFIASEKDKKLGFITGIIGLILICSHYFLYFSYVSLELFIGMSFVITSTLCHSLYNKIKT